MKKRIISALVFAVIVSAPVQAKKQPVEHKPSPEQIYHKCVADGETVLGLKTADSSRYLQEQGWSRASDGWHKAGHSLMLTERRGHISQAKIVK